MAIPGEYNTDKRLGQTFRFVSKDVQANPIQVMRAVRQNPDAMEFASVELRSNPDFMMEAATVNPRTLRYTAPALLGNKDFMLDAARAYPEHNLDFKFTKSKLQEDSTLMYARSHGPAISDADWPQVKASLIKNHAMLNAVSMENVSGVQTHVENVLNPPVIDQSVELPDFSWGETETNSEALSVEETNDETNYEEELRACRKQMEQKQAQGRER